MKILCLIPARSGSKGLPDKNIKMMVNKPLMVWSIFIISYNRPFNIVNGIGFSISIITITVYTIVDALKYNYVYLYETWRNHK